MGYLVKSLRIRLESREQKLEIAKTYWSGVYDERETKLSILVESLI